MYSETTIIKQPVINGPTSMATWSLMLVQHPSTHGVLHLLITLNGEIIKNRTASWLYIHRSIEKMCESLSFRQFIYVTSKMDYLSSHINNHGCCLCRERYAD